MEIIINPSISSPTRWHILIHGSQYHLIWGGDVEAPSLRQALNLALDEAGIYSTVDKGDPHENS